MLSWRNSSSPSQVVSPKKLMIPYRVMSLLRSELEAFVQDSSRSGFSGMQRLTRESIRHGPLRAESEPEKGSTFIIRLPVKQDRWEGI
jgi:hypothetical protein